MKRTSAANLLLLLLALVGSLAVAWPRQRGSGGRNIVRAGAHEATRTRVPLAGGGFGVADASGYLVPLRDYRRIVSTNLVYWKDLPDALLVDDFQIGLGALLALVLTSPRVPIPAIATSTPRLTDRSNRLSGAR